jgi:hypothetical protein
MIRPTNIAVQASSRRENELNVQTQQDDSESKASRVAMDVGARRKAGEIVTDEQVLKDYPELRASLKIHLERLRHADSEVPLGDLEQTQDLPADSFGSAVETRLTVEEQPRDSNFRRTLVVGDSVSNPEMIEPPTTPLYRPSVRPPMAVVKLFHDGATTYTPYTVFADRFRIGRIDGDVVVLHDSWMSGRHAEIQRRRVGDRFHWYLVDQKSTNGSFVRSDSTVLKNNDELFLGQERYRFSTQNGRAGLIHATKGVGQQWWFRGRKEIIGSKPPCGLPSFATDPYLDPEHAILIQRSDGAWEIHDNNSQNGLWYRIMEIELSSNSAFQLGEQRFGFWFNDER